MSLAENLEAIQQRIRAACERAGRDPATVTLLAVTKTHPPETVKAAVEAGQLLFGENKVQEAKAKIPLCPGKARWHFIGHLQSNKCRDAVHFFEMIQSVDSLALAEEIDKRAEQAAKTGPGGPAQLDTLSAAYAEAGRYSEAVAAAREAIDLARAAGNVDAGEVTLPAAM